MVDITVPAGGYTPQTFADDLLKLIGAPVSAGNVDFIEAWEAKEGGNWNNTARYNPLNTSLPAPGATPYKPGAGVKSYTSWGQGLGATATTLLEDRYRAVVAALRGDDQTGALSALVASPWDQDHYGGGSSFPTSAAGAAYAKAHAKGGGGGGGVLGDIGRAAGDLNPFTVGQKAVSAVTDPITGAVGAVWTDFKDFAIKMTFTGLGLGLVTIGLYPTAKPTIGRATKAAGEAAQAAAVVAA